VRLLSYGRRGLLVELDSLDEALRLSADLDRKPAGGILELVPGARTVLIRFDPARTSAARLAAELVERAGSGAATSSEPMNDSRTDDDPATDQVEIPVVYDGPDLDEVARLTGLTSSDVVKRHCAASYLVAFTGFAPGFGYLSGGGSALAVPRRATPRTRVPAGAVGLAGEFTGVYPRPGPGGWQLIGRTQLTMWDVQRTPAALLRPGVRVTFRAVSS
jgi:KipI family sensor histidine kinase inhibitor